MRDLDCFGRALRTNTNSVINLQKAQNATRPSGTVLCSSISLNETESNINPAREISIKGTSCSILQEDVDGVRHDESRFKLFQIYQKL